jgi:murein DD-endopeptidase MepM/ murein hydrolase activator NlpD
LTDKKKLQERFRKTLKKTVDAEKSEINNESKLQPNEDNTAATMDHEKLAHSDLDPKSQIDDWQNFKKSNYKVNQNRKFSPDGRYQQKQHSTKTKPQKRSIPAKLKSHTTKETEKVDHKSSRVKGAFGSADKDRIKTANGSRKTTLKKLNKERTQKIYKQLQQKGFALPYAIKNTTENYGRLDEQKDSDENSAVLATDEGVSLARKAIIRADKTKQPKLKFEVTQDKGKVVSKQEVPKQRLSYVKQTSTTSNANQINKNQQKRSIKKAYGKEKQTAFYSGLKDRLKNSFKQVKEWATKGLKKFAIYMIGPLFMFVVASVLILSMVQSFSGAVSTVVSTSYQSSDLVITSADVLYTRLEADLLYAINHVEEDHSSYDEYQYNVDAVGHDPQMLIAYLTAKYGEFTVADASNELSRVFDLHYNYQLVEKIETRYRTVRETSVDPVTGETTTTTSQEEYDWYILKINLDTNDLDQTLSSQLNDEEKDYYQTLISTEGNFISFPSPIREDWKTSVSSPFGYRLDPISKEVTFHAGIDIAKPTGTELITIIDGMVIQTGYDANGYGHFIVVEEKTSKQTVLYGHCNSLIASEGDEVKLGQTIATIGSSGKSTGPHVHLEIRDSSGNKLNPYFYLSSEFVEVE